MSETTGTPIENQTPESDEPITTIPVVEPLPDAEPETEAPKEEARA